MNIVEFNRDDFEWAEEFYKLIKIKLKLPDWFGMNADALWDMLTGYVKLPCKFIFIGFNKNENKYNDIKITTILKCFLDAQKQFPNNIIVSFID